LEGETMTILLSLIWSTTLSEMPDEAAPTMNEGLLAIRVSVDALETARSLVSFSSWMS
jgi:hypothetical protein